VINKIVLISQHFFLFDIILAHKFIKHCKGSLMSRVADLDELKAKLGQCLYTLQSFYSNTNWVEMYGNKVYEDFGTLHTFDSSALCA
jgi:hypothetical protein